MPDLDIEKVDRNLTVAASVNAPDLELHDVRNAMRINYFEDKELIAAQAKAYAEKNA